MIKTAFRLDPTLDARSLAARFRERRRLHIPGFLVAEGAEGLLAFLKASNDWKLVLNQGDKLFELDRAAQAELQGERAQQLELAVYAAAQKGFQYRYESLRAPDGDADREAEPTPLNIFARFLSSEPALSLLRTVTGADDIEFADAQATAYSPGHFLTTHSDEVEGKNRRAAYVMNLTHGWQVDWGGLLTFPVEGGTAEAFVPAFNALNIFAVPQAHNVGIVAPFAARRRYSVTGWLRAGQRP